MAKKRFMKEGSLQLVMFIDLGSSFLFIILGSGYEIASSFCVYILFSLPGQTVESRKAFVINWDRLCHLTICGTFCKTARKLWKSDMASRNMCSL